MLSETHRNSLQEQVIYGRPALELTDLAKAFGAHRLMITSTATLAEPGGLVQHLAKDYGAGCVGIFAGVSAHSPRSGPQCGCQLVLPQVTGRLFDHRRRCRVRPPDQLAEAC
jgi:hypothetical protein